MRRNRIGEQWDIYARKVLEGCPPIQKQECRRAFYAGCWTFYSIQMGDLSDGADGTTPADLQLMADLHAELMDFANQVRSGTA